MSLEEVSDYTLGSLVVVGNAAFLYTIQKSKKSSKFASRMFLSQMSAAGIVTGFCYLVRGTLTTMDQANKTACLLLTSTTRSAIGLYASQMFFVYLELYLSIERMKTTSALSVLQTTMLSCGGLIFWILLCFIGIVFAPADYRFDSFHDCRFGIYPKAYKVSNYVAYALTLLVTSLAHFLSIRKTHKGLRDQLQNHGPGASRTTWLRNRKRILNTMLVLLIIYIVSWSGVLVIQQLITFCASCQELLVQRILYTVSRVVITLPYLANGLVHVIRNRKTLRGCCKRNAIYPVNA